MALAQKLPKRLGRVRATRKAARHADNGNGLSTLAFQRIELVLQVLDRGKGALGC